MAVSPARFLFAVAALLAGGCATPVATAPVAAAASEVDLIRMETNSWGRPISSWQMDRRGEGEYREARPAPSGNFHEYDLVTKRFQAGPDGFLRLRDLLRPAEQFAAGEGPDCGSQVTDLPYGEAVWVGGGAERTVRFNLGCQGRDAVRMNEALGAAETQIREWAARAPITDIREIRQPSR